MANCPANRLTSSLAHDICYRKDLVFHGEGNVSWTHEEPHLSGRTVALPTDLSEPDTIAVRLATVLHYSVGLLRWEPGYGFRAHRGFPSARSGYATQVFLGTPGDAELAEGFFQYQATQHRLLELAGQGTWAKIATCLGSPIPRDSIAVVVALDFKRLSTRYGDFAYSLCSMEAGHAIWNLTHTASEMGFRPSAHFLFRESVLRDLVGTGRTSVTPVAVLILHGSEGWVRGSPPPVLTPEASEYPEIPNFPRASELEREIGKETGCGASEVEVPQVAGPRQAVHRLPEETRLALARRTSGWGGPIGELNPNPISLPKQILLDSLDSDWLPVAHDLGATHPVAGRFAVSIRFEDLPQGIYSWSKSQGLLQIAQGDPRPPLREAYSYPMDQGNLHAIAGAVFTSVDYSSAIRQWGPRGLRITDIICGAVVQGMGLVASRNRAFARPVRAFKDDALEELLGLAGRGATVPYGVLFGANRHAVISFDLSL